jgi:hypothetical protein
MKTLAEIERLERYIHQHKKPGEPVSPELLATFAKLPRYPAPEPLVADMTDTSFQYCEAIRRYLLGRDHPDFIDEQRMFSLMSAKSIVVPWGHAPKGWPHI